MRVVKENLWRLGSTEERRFDEAFWREAGHEARFAAAWDMTKEAALFRGQDAGESRLQRHIQHIQRRKG